MTQHPRNRIPIRTAAGAGITAALLAALVAGAPAGYATDSVTEGVTGGSLTASVANLGLTGIATHHTNQNKTGSMTLTVDDSTGTGSGWNVTIETSDFAYDGDYNGVDIPAENFSLTSAGTPSMTAGQTVDSTDGPKVPGTSPVGTLDQARKTVQASVDFGKGTYTQSLGVNLVVPADSLVGTYTGTLTTTVSASP